MKMNPTFQLRGMKYIIRYTHTIHKKGVTAYQKKLLKDIKEWKTIPSRLLILKLKQRHMK